MQIIQITIGADDNWGGGKAKQTHESAPLMFVGKKTGR